MNEQATETPHVQTLEAATPRRALLLAAVAASLACAPWSWIVDGLTPSWVVYPLVLIVALWRIGRGKGALLLAIAATVFLVVHLPWAWSALTGERAGSVPEDLAVHRFAWAVTLFFVPLFTAVAGFAAWREGRR